MNPPSLSPELLSPAGDFEKLTMAVAYGADAVYLAGSSFGMRTGTANFPGQSLREAISYCHSHHVRAYVTCNTVPTENDLIELPDFISSCSEYHADALIVTDLGVLSLIRKIAPELEIHISTQSGVMNSAAAKAFWELGAKRIVLARETSIDSIRKIRNSVPPELELEAFCHGSMCVSFSGRCLLSSYLTGRDSNRGDCAQPCRWKYHLVEEHRPGDYYEISEDKGTFILNARDLCTIRRIRELTNAGISSFKIEGRTKSSYYAASATAAYRHAIDCAVSGVDLPDIWAEEVFKLSHRPYTEGFYFGKPDQYYDSSSYFSEWDVVAMVESCDSYGNACISQRNSFKTGDTVELLQPNGDPVSFQIGFMTDAEATPIIVARHPKMMLYTHLPVTAEPYSFIRKPRMNDLPGHLAGKE